MKPGPLGLLLALGLVIGVPAGALAQRPDRISIEITHVDPANYEKPLVVTITYPTSDFELMEYGCNPDDAAVVEPN
jgi:hypothetical protein